MQELLAQVAEFHSAIGAPVAVTPGLLPADQEHVPAVAMALRKVGEECRLSSGAPNDLFARLALAIEELAEWVEAHGAGDLVKAADALGDRLYVLVGDAVAVGCPLHEVFAAVHRSNMTKVGSSVDSFGKAKKGIGYLVPQLQYGADQISIRGEKAQ